MTRLPARSAAAAIREMGSDGERALETQLKQKDIRGWVREFKFHPARMWRFDFAWPDLKVAVEIEGGIWTEGRHTRGSSFEGDAEKYNVAALLGWLVLRVTPDMVLQGRALGWAEQAVEVRRLELAHQ